MDATINVTKPKYDKELNFTPLDFSIYFHHDIILNKKLSHRVSVPQIKNASRFSIPDPQSKNNYSFHKLFLNEFTYAILLMNNFTFVCVFNPATNSYLMKMYMLHITIAFFNFIGEGSSLLQSNSMSSPNLSENRTTNDIFQVKLFETFFVAPITKHFDKLIRFLFKKEELNLVNIKLKNFYVVDVSNNEIICDLSSIRKGKRTKKLQKNEKLWQELLHHSKLLKASYQHDNDGKCDTSLTGHNFIKIECTSTYPRLTFVIKFLPILNGVSIIHVYSQNKLSRLNDNEAGSTSQKNIYKEIEIIQGNEIIKSQNNIEFRYTEPRKLKEIEKFFIEYYLNTNGKLEGYLNVKYELKYLNSFLLRLIDDMINLHKQLGYEGILMKINSKLYDVYVNGEERKLGVGNVSSNEKSLTSLENSNRRNKEANSDLGANSNINYNFMMIQKEFVLHELFNQMKSKQSNMFSNIEDTPFKANDAISLDFVNQMSEISQFQCDYEGDKISNSYIGVGNMGNIINPNESLSFDLTIIESRKDDEENNQQEKKNIRLDLNKLQRSIQNLEKKNSILGQGKNGSPIGSKSRTSLIDGKSFNARRKSEEPKGKKNTIKEFVSELNLNSMKLNKQVIEVEGWNGEKEKEENHEALATENQPLEENAIFLSRGTFGLRDTLIKK